MKNLFEGSEIRSIWDSEKEEYYFSVVDVISVLTNSANPRNYWNMLKRMLNDEGSELYENIVQLKTKSSKDGKIYKTDTLKILLSLKKVKKEIKRWRKQVVHGLCTTENEVF